MHVHNTTSVSHPWSLSLPIAYHQRNAALCSVSLAAKTSTNTRRHSQVSCLYTPRTQTDISTDQPTTHLTQHTRTLHCTALTQLHANRGSKSSLISWRSFDNAPQTDSVVYTDGGQSTRLGLAFLTLFIMSLDPDPQQIVRDVPTNANGFARRRHTTHANQYSKVM